MADRKLGFSPHREKPRTNSGLVIPDGNLDEIKKVIEETLEIARSREGSERQETDVHLTQDLLLGIKAAKDIQDLLGIVFESGIILPDNNSKQKEPLGFHVPKKDKEVVSKKNSPN